MAACQPRFNHTLVTSKVHFRWWLDIVEMLTLICRGQGVAEILANLETVCPEMQLRGHPILSAKNKHVSAYSTTFWSYIDFERLRVQTSDTSQNH